MTGRTKRWAVSVALAAAVLAATGSLGTPAARAEQKPTETVSASTKSILDEIAGALGFADSNSDGFWEAYAKARAEDLESADRARTDAADQIVRDAATYGRRVEETQGSLTQFVEYIAPASGDVVDDEVYVRTGEEKIDPKTGNGTRWTKYYKGIEPAALVESELKDGTETVTRPTSTPTGRSSASWRP